MNDYIFELWSLVEADFLREYRIPLVEDIGSMTFRYFCTLVTGLSSKSRFVSAYQQDQQAIKEGKKVIEDPHEGERAVNRIWG